MIRSSMNSKFKSTLTLRELIISLNDTQRGIFQSQSKFICLFILIDQIQELVLELCQLVPEWIQVKNIGMSGRFVKIMPSISGQHVLDQLRQKIYEES